MRFESRVFRTDLFETGMSDGMWTLLRLVIPHCDSNVLKSFAKSSKRLRAYVYVNWFLRDALVREGQAFRMYMRSLEREIERLNSNYVPVELEDFLRLPIRIEDSPQYLECRPINLELSGDRCQE